MRSYKGSVANVVEYSLRNGRVFSVEFAYEKTGNLVAIKGVTDKEDLMIINKFGIGLANMIT